MILCLNLCVLVRVFVTSWLIVTTSKSLTANWRFFINFQGFWFADLLTRSRGEVVKSQKIMFSEYQRKVWLVVKQHLDKWRKISEDFYDDLKIGFNEASVSLRSAWVTLKLLKISIQMENYCEHSRGSPICCAAVTYMTI